MELQFKNTYELPVNLRHKQSHKLGRTSQKNKTFHFRPITFMTCVAYDPVKLKLSGKEVEEPSNCAAWNQVLRLAYSLVSGYNLTI